VREVSGCRATTVDERADQADQLGDKRRQANDLESIENEVKRTDEDGHRGNEREDGTHQRFDPIGAIRPPAISGVAFRHRDDAIRQTRQHPIKGFEDFWCRQWPAVQGDFLRLGADGR